MSEPKRCDGPVYFADQGIEVCETCTEMGGAVACLCCLDEGQVDHSAAIYRCHIWEGQCLLDSFIGSTHKHVCGEAEQRWP